jgi:hypothetical protein
MVERSADRRQRTIFLSWPERRSGFDRRDEAAVEVLRDSPALLAAVLSVLNILNVLDWRLTAFAIQQGASEGNPVMAALFGVDALAAGLFKVALMLAMTFVIWRSRRYRRVLELAVIATMMYTALIAYHLFGLGLILPYS